MVSGNVLVFAFGASWTAVRGSRVGAWVFLAMVVLMPRPLFLPVVAWLLWRQPSLRMPAVCILTVNVALVLVSGLGPAWADRLLSTATSEMQHPLNLAPTRWIGAVWIPIGLALAVWLVRRGSLGLASLAASPYLFGYYPLFGLLELRSLKAFRGTWPGRVQGLSGGGSEPTEMEPTEGIEPTTGGLQKGRQTVRGCPSTPRLSTNPE